MLYEDYLKSLSGCPFCDKNNYEKQLLEENKHSILIISLAPYQKHHLLIVPKRHIEKIVDINEEEERNINKLQRTAIKILYKLGYEDMSILIREGENVGKSVRHLHYHIIPEIPIGVIGKNMKKRMIIEKEEIEYIMEKLSKIIKNKIFDCF